MSSVCIGPVSAFYGSLYQQRICWSTEKSPFTPIFVVSRVALSIVNKLQNVTKGKARNFGVAWRISKQEGIL